MSIIHDALKKVQSKRSENTTVQKKFAPVAKQPPTDSIIADTALKPRLTVPQNSWAINRLLWSLLFVILLGFTFYNLYEYNVRTTEIAIAHSSAQSLLDKNTNSIQPSVTPVAVAHTPTPPQPKKGELILSGVVEMDGKNFALINNEFYETGETVEGAKITRITTDSINILQKNKHRTIKILRPREP